MNKYSNNYLLLYLQSKDRYANMNMEITQVGSSSNYTDVWVNSNLYNSKRVKLFSVSIPNHKLDSFIKNYRNIKIDALIK